MKAGLSTVGSSRNRPVADKLSGPHIRECDRTTLCRTTRIVATNVSSQPFSLMWWVTCAACLQVITSIGGEGSASAFLSLRNMPCLYLSINEVPSKTWTAKFSNNLNQTRTFKSPSCTKRRIVPSSEMDSFVATRSGSNCCFSMFESHFFFRNAFLTWLSPALVSRTHLCGCGCWAMTPRFISIIYIDIESSLTAVGATWKTNSSTKTLLVKELIARGARPSVVADLTHLGIASFLVWQSQRILLSPFDGNRYENVPSVFLFRFFFQVGSVIPTVLTPLMLGRPVVSLVICGVTSCWDVLTKDALLVAFPSEGSLHVKVMNSCKSFLLFLRDERTVMHPMRFVESQHVAIDFVCPYFRALLIRWRVGQYEGAINNPEHIAIMFEFIPGSRPNEVDLALDDVIAFTDLPWFRYPCCRLWDFAPTWLRKDSIWPPFNLSDDFAWNARFGRQSDFREAQLPLMLWPMGFRSRLVKISFRFCFSYAPPHRRTLATNSSAYCVGVLFGRWENMVVSSSGSAIYSSVA